METQTSFSDWLIVQLRERGWDQAELVRRSRLSSGTISRIVTGSRTAGTDAAKGIARALNLPVEDVLRRAGILPTPARLVADDRRMTQDLIRKLERLSPEDRRYVAELLNRIFPNASE